MSLKCSRLGCGKTYDPELATGNSCSYHPGPPVFHEGLKSYACCKELPGHRPVLDFDEWQRIPGCTTGKHSTTEAPVKPATSAATSSRSGPSDVTMSTSADGKEVYSSGATKAAETVTARPPSPPPAPKKVEEDEDDLAVAVSPGTKCLRSGCGVEFVNDAESRQGDGPLAECQYHPMPPLFREGSKGYLCCKPKVLEFDEFLKIRGCKTGRHVFAKKQKSMEATEELVQPRIDHYQTPSAVHVSVFAKQVDKDRSTVVFEEELVHLDLYLPAGKRCMQTLSLYGTIDPSASTHRILGTKVEITLVKRQARSWTLLEKTDAQLPEAFGYTFSAGGRTGTVGGKELVLDPNNKVD